MKLFGKTSYFWIFFVATSFIAALLAYNYFSRAFPIIHLNLTMNRSQAVDAAQQIAQQFQLGPQNGHHATSFITDENVKTFVELEAGGKEAFVSMIDKNLYQPYTWVVREFKPFEHNELFVRLTPDGIPYGFQEKLSENSPGTNATQSEAQTLAETFAAAAPWNITFNTYKLVETSQETKTSGRIDHTIMYERTDATLGDGFYRLKIVVSGDHISELDHSVKVPEAFERRYQQMRSANETISYIANLIMMLLYLLGCMVGGLVFLFKQRWAIWNAPLYWALFISAIVSMNIANQLPLLWMEYNTALSPYGFLMQLGIGIFSSFIVNSVLFTLIFMAAEGVTRKAFGNQIQLWRLFDSSAASSYTIAGYTLSGYLLVPITLAYTVIFYLTTTYFFSWWTPAWALFNPNILATYFPWLESLSFSLQAGFYEECLFRALPLACAALLGTRFGKRNWWIAGAFIMQALVFGAAHANYPAQPAYARLVELIGISTLFGVVYLRFGLLISIIAHFVYDVFWFALPLFISVAPYAWINKGIVVLLALTPVWIVLIARIKQGRWHTIPARLYNKAWQPSTKIFTKASSPTQKTAPPFRSTYLYLLIAIGVIGLSTWIATTQFHNDSYKFSTTRTEIQKQAALDITNKGIDLNQWHSMVYPITQLEQNADLMKRHRFVWREGGKNIYQQLLKTYLTPQSWVARFVKWQGTIDERSEEHHLFYMPDGALYRYTHKLAESSPGASLSKSDAQTKALEIIKQQFNQTAEQLNEVSSIATKQPERLDWVVTYSSKTEYPLNQGEGRIAVSLSGDQVVDTYRYVHVPEQWERDEQNRQLFAQNSMYLCILFSYLLLLFCALFAAFKWHMSPHTLVVTFLILSMILLFELGNYWPTLLASFNTSQPFSEQLFRMFSLPAIMVVLRAAVLAVMISLICQFPNIYRAVPSYISLCSGIGLGIFCAGMLSFTKWIFPALSPTWANYIPLGFWSPIANSIDGNVISYLSTTINLLLFIMLLDTITRYWQRLKLLGIGLFFIAGFVTAGLINSYNIPLMMANGILLTMLFLISYFVAVRFDRSIVPIAVGSFVILRMLQQAIFNAYSHAALSYIVTMCVIACIAWYWHEKLQQASLLQDQGL